MFLYKQSFLKDDRVCKILAILIIVAYFLINMAASMYHEAWRDEAQAWTIAKNLSVVEIFNILSTEGHLFPWFIILKIWFLFGGKFSSIGILSIAIMTVSIWLIIHYAPYPVYMKLIIAFSPIVFYYNAVISRCYCISTFIVILTAIFRKKRKEKSLAYAVCVAFTMQTHVLLLPLGIILCFEFVLENIKQFKGRQSLILGVPIFSFFLALVELYQRGNKPVYISVTSESVISNIDGAVIMGGLRSILGPLYDYKGINKIIPVIVWLLFLISFVLEIMIKNNFHEMLQELIVIFTGIGGYLLIVCLVRSCAHVQMSITFYLIILFDVWIMLDENDNFPLSTFLFGILLVLSLKNEVGDISYDINNRFSNSKAMAEDIVRVIPMNSTIIVHQNAQVSGVYSYVTDKRPDIVFWDVDRNEIFKCIVWGEEYVKSDVNKVSALFDGAVYLLEVEKKGDDNRKKLIVSEAQDNKWEEDFWLYELEK